jgi:cobyric acid synthase CobQ/L-threonine-O-3-phosphate decarboxylase
MKNPCHGGNVWKLGREAGLASGDLLDFSANINPLGPPPWLRALIARRLEDVRHYPDPESRELVEALARRFRLASADILVGNGSTELLRTLIQVLGARRALIPVPAYSDYRAAAELAGLPVATLPLREADGFVLDWNGLESAIQSGDAVFLGQPNNPTGFLLDPSRLRSLAAGRRDVFFIVDEAFLDFVPQTDSLLSARPDNVAVLRSMTKFYAIPGLRLGFAAAAPDLATRVRARLPPWSVSTLAQAVGVAALADQDYARETIALVENRRRELSDGLVALGGVTVYPGVANFLLCRLDRHGLDAAALADRLLRQGIAIRVCESFEGLDGRFFRLAVRNAEEQTRLLEVLAEALSPASRPAPRRTGPLSPRAATLMFQGTCSNAGKSVLTAAFCRILLQDGFRVAPFKAQNMALNSGVTRDGLEMGRAQVVQARACRLEPDVRMNPILLKPNSEMGSQVIVMGKPVGNMDVHAYARFKETVFRTVTDAFDSLAAEFDAVILEGAGSPGEVNLKRQDIVNMRMARHARAPVLLVGDIDRGGVFASFVGTLEVLEEWERRLIAGFVVNRFRGDPSLLAPAYDYVFAHTGRPVLGTVPFLPNLALPQEDSVDFKNRVLDRPAPDAAVRLAVLDLAHISNFTDLDPFRAEPDVDLRIIRTPADWTGADAVILPGSKNVIADLQALRRSGLADRLAEAARAGIEIVGICGGFQMLGCDLADPHRIESDAGAVPGLGLLDVATVLEPDKALTRTEARHLASGLPVRGYEIHHGQTRSLGAAVPAFVTASGVPVGFTGGDGRVWGTYLHGVFDDDAFRRWFLDSLRRRKGLPPAGRVLAPYDLEPELDRLADAVRKSLDMPRIRRLLADLPNRSGHA